MRIGGRRLTLAGAFALGAAGAAVLVAGILHLLLTSWRDSIVERARTLREESTAGIGAQVEASLYGAQSVLEHLESLVRLGALSPDDPAAVEAALFSQLLAHPGLYEATLTRAPRPEEPATGPTGQVSVMRMLADAPRLVTRRIEGGRAGFRAWRRERPPGGGLFGAPLVPEGEAPDPAAHLTFRTTASAEFYGRALWSDLHWAESDGALPPERRRVVVTVNKAIPDTRGRFAGVLRVGLLTDQIDALARRESARKAPHVVFLCDEQGRLVSRLGDGDRFREEPDESLRVAAAALPAEVAAALRDPALRTLSTERPMASAALAAGGRRHLATYALLGRTLGWRVGMVAPEDHYLGGYRRARDRALLGAGALFAGLVLFGGAGLRALRRGLGRIVDAAARMRRFDFAPDAVRSGFRDVQEVVESLELAKTALRAMGRYVPVDLVRHLYETRREPQLGAEPIEVSILFTDVRDFTSLAERLPPDELADMLGRYLQAMTTAIHDTGGIVDKYVGDAVMALWNAPRPVADHARRACQAALACRAATERLFASREWAGRPPLVTRYGIHTARVLVGHFGAPDRLSYTAVGDGVNLASRLEGLNKAYGTTVIVSDAVRARAGEGFAFRLLDRVAVKGRTQGVAVHELIADGSAERLAAARAYEAALADYWRRDFEGALRRLETLPDAASRALAQRCRALLLDPPGPDWDGVAMAAAK